ncbi:MAG: TetR/AcrR family transcriptional regulator [Acidimicrobiales bacterium]
MPAARRDTRVLPRTPAAGGAAREAPVGPPPPRRLRADAEVNRVALLGAAREVFAEQGLKAPLEEIARRAGVGIGTLYRRFPRRESLVAAALIEKIAEYDEYAEQGLADPDPGTGFVCFVMKICAMQVHDRGLGDLLAMTLPAGQQVDELRNRANGKVVELVERAKAAGGLRQDFTGEDLLVMLIANAAVVHVTGTDAPEAWRRFAALALDGFRCHDGAVLPAPPSTAEMESAMQRLARERGCGVTNASWPE